MGTDHQKLSIKMWAEEDRPREKLLLKGRSALSDSELVALLIGSGNNKVSAVELSKEILNSAENDLSKLGKLTIKELMRFEGIGEAKAISIAAAMELGRRRRTGTKKREQKITTSTDVFELMRSHFEDLPHEEFWVILLNRGNVVLGKRKISQGGVSGTVADPKIIFKMAIEHLASAIVLCHNHPSGNLYPSDADIKLTEQMVKSGNLIGIPVVDHVIFAEKNFYSFTDEGAI
jgi:DNA repair protein RadC